MLILYFCQPQAVKSSQLASLENDNYVEEALGEEYVDDEDDEGAVSFLFLLPPLSSLPSLLSLPPPPLLSSRLPFACLPCAIHGVGRGVYR